MSHGADVQLEHGYIRIANRLYEAMLGADFSPVQFKMLHGLIRLSYGWGRRTVTLSHGELADAIGATASGHFRGALRDLIDSGVVLLVDAGTGARRATYAVQKDFTKWGRWATHPDRLKARYGTRPEAHDELLPRSSRERDKNGAGDNFDDDLEGACFQAPSPPPDRDPARKQAGRVPESRQGGCLEAGTLTGPKSLHGETVGPRKDIERQERQTTKANSKQPLAARDVSIDEQKHRYSVALAVATNTSIEKRWGEQTHVLHFATGAELAAELFGAGVPIEVAELAIASVCRASKQRRPPGSISYFRGAILDAVRDAEQRELNATNTNGKRGGDPRPLAHVLYPAQKRDDRDVRRAYDEARRAAAIAWRKDPANKAAQHEIVEAVRARYDTVAESPWRDRAIDADVVAACATAAGFPDHETWLEQRAPALEESRS